MSRNKIEWKSALPPAAPEVIRATEEALGVKLPADFVSLLLEMNGATARGLPGDYSVPVVGYPGGTSALVDCIYSVNNDAVWGGVLKSTRTLGDRLADGFVVIGGTAGHAWYVLGTRGERAGQIFLLDGDEEDPDDPEAGLFFVAASFTEFLNMMEWEAEDV